MGDERQHEVESRGLAGKDGLYPVPAEWLRAGEEARVIARVENTWRAPDGLVLGILLQRAGLVQ